MSALRPPPFSYSAEVYHSYVGGEDGELFEQACFTTVVTCGPPAPRPGLMQSWSDLPDDAPTQRNDWLLAVEQHTVDRYGLDPTNIGLFITAFEMWWQQQKESADECEVPEVGASLSRVLDCDWPTTC